VNFNLLFHSLRIKERACKGCTHCLRICPTDAIRVRQGTAVIKDLKCIDCGDCVRVCPYHASEVVTDDLTKVERFAYPILVIPSVFQTIALRGLTYLEAVSRLFSLGFREVWEEGVGNEIFLRKNREVLLDETTRRPMLSTICPAVLRLLQVRFPGLLGNLGSLNAPKDILGSLIRRERAELPGIGLFYLSPCPAKVTATRNPQGLHQAPYDGVIAVRNLFNRIHSAPAGGEGTFIRAGRLGIAFGHLGGEKEALPGQRVISIDGMNNVRGFLERLEEGKTPPFDYVEARACPVGCVGGVLLPEQDPYIANYRLEYEMKRRPEFSPDFDTSAVEGDFLYLHEVIHPRPQYFLSENLTVAARMMRRIDEIYAQLPHIDCGSCGAPTCRALAEDIAKGEANPEDCVFLTKEGWKFILAKPNRSETAENA